LFVDGLELCLGDAQCPSGTFVLYLPYGSILVEPSPESTAIVKIDVLVKFLKNIRKTCK